MTYDIIHKNSTVAGTPPAAGEIEVGEIAINAADAALYVKDTNGDIKNVVTDALFTQAGTGAVQRTVESKLQDVVSVKDFGAVGDGVADDTLVIQATITQLQAGSTLVFPSGTYKLTAPLTFSGKSNITFVGYNATVRCGDTRIEGYFDVRGGSNLTFLGFTFDGRMQNMPLYTSADYSNLYNCGIFCKSSSANNIKIEDCSFVNLYTRGASFVSTSVVEVLNCRFTSPLQSQDQLLEHLYFVSCSSVKINDCNFINASNTSPATNACGIVASGIRGYIIIDKCTFDYCGRDNTGSHRLAVIDFYYDVDNVVVTNCVSRNTMAEFMRLSSCDSAQIVNNIIEINANCEIGSNTLALQSGVFAPGAGNIKCRNVLISDNVFENNTNVLIAVAVGVFSYDWGAWSENVIISNNTFHNFDRSVYIIGPFVGVKVLGNVLTRDGLIELLHNPSMTSNHGPQSSSFFTGLDISNNTMCSTTRTGRISLNLSTITTTAYVGTFCITNNLLESIGSVNSNVAINMQLISTIPANTTAVVEGNLTKKYAFGFQLRDSGNVVYGNNKSVSNTGGLIQSGNLSFNQYNNMTL